MPLKFNVGLSKKVGLPDFGSLGASCHVEVELDGSLLEGDPDRLQHQVRRAYVACAQAVNDELTRQHGNESPATNGAAQRAESSSNANGNGRAGRRFGGAPRKATDSQVRAIHAIANRQGIELASLLHERFGLHQPGDLTIVEASRLIDELKGAANGAGEGR